MAHQPSSQDDNLENQVMSVQGSAALNSAVMMNGTSGTSGYGAVNSAPTPLPPRDDEQEVRESGTGMMSGTGNDGPVGCEESTGASAAGPEMASVHGRAGANHPAGYDAGLGEVAGDSGADYFTPRSRRSAVQWGPMSQFEALPAGFSWLSRVGARILGAVNAGDMLPSPLASPPRPQLQASSSSTPQRPRTVAAVTPPASSSGMSVEMVQAEVQRQLGPLLDRLEAAESRNQQLESQLRQRALNPRDRDREGVAVTQRPQQDLGLPSSEAVGLQGPPRSEQAGSGGLRGGLTTVAEDSRRQRDPLYLVEHVSSGEHQGGLAPLSGHVGGQQGHPRSEQAGSGGQQGHPRSEQAGSGGLRGGLDLSLEGVVVSHGHPRSEQAGSGGLRGGQEYTNHDSREGRSQRALDVGEGENHGGQGLLGSLFGRPRGRSPSPVPDPIASQTAPMIEAIARGVRQLQELQERRFQEGGTSPGGTETVKPGVQSLLALQPPGTRESPLIFQDWIEVISTGMKDLSENSGAWWEAVLRTVEGTYAKWLGATQLERLTIVPEDADYASKGRWARVNARACQLLLTAVPENVRADLIARRSTQDITQLVFRLYVTYQPGGSSERGHTLAQLQNPPVGASIQETLEILRSWPRHLRRCHQLGMNTPDPTVLAKGLDNATSKTISGSADAQFRTQLVRTTLRLDAKPSLESVENYQRHLQAEVEQLASSAGVEPTAKLRATTMGQQTQPSSPSSTTPTTTSAKEGRNEAACRYFAKPSGCRRGERCPYRHDLAAFPKDQRMKKCLACGAEGHRARECPTKTTRKPLGKGEDGAERQGQSISPKVAEIQACGATMSSSTSTMTTAPTTTPASTLTASSSGMSDIGPTTTPGEPVWTLDNLMQAAQQVVMAKNAGERDVIKINAIQVSSPDTGKRGPRMSPLALADTGATHPLRRPHDEEEWKQSTPVNVLLAGGEQVSMRMNSLGTLLMQEENKTQDAISNAIVPVGELVKTLGYRFEWGPNSCHLVNPDGGIVRMSTTDGCPHLTEAKALELIAKIEKKKLDQFTEAGSWFDYLCESILENTSMERKAIAASPFFKDVPDEVLKDLAVDTKEESGWEILKGLTFLNRRQRRRLWLSKGWVVHLFAGKKKKEVFEWMNGGDKTLLELDIERSQGHNLLDPQLWKALSWGASQGKIVALLGGPPCRTFSRLRFRENGPSPVRTRSNPYGWEGQTRDQREQVIKDSKLFARMLWLHAKATAGRLRVPGRRMSATMVAFVLEQPQDPQGYLPNSDPHWSELPSFWDTEMWKRYSEEAGFVEVSFEQGAFGHKTCKPTTLGTNLLALTLLRGAKASQDLKPFNGPSEELAEWAPGLCVAISLALREWLVTPTLTTMTVSQWKEHVARGHLPPRRDCMYCNMYGASGRPHRRIAHPEMFTLSSDLSGPHDPGLNHNARSPFYKPFKNLLVCKYRFPVSFATGQWEETADDGEVAMDEDPFDAGKEQEAELEDYAPTDIEEEAQANLGKEDIAKLLDGQEVHEINDAGEDKEDSDEDLGEAPEKKAGGNPQMREGDTEAPKSTYLVFATPLTTGTSAEILEALQDVITYLRHHNLPVLRHHSDKASAFQGKAIRMYLKNQSIRVTTSEPGIPQSNGAIEQTVRWVKQRARTLLGAAGVSKKLWPQAAATAAAMQRAQTLGFLTKLVAPFGTRVMVKKRHYDVDPKEKKKTKDSSGVKWEEGRYVGLSDYVQGGHLIYHEGRNNFIHTMNVRAGLHDPGPPDGLLEADPSPPPPRRLTRKTHIGFEEEPPRERAVAVMDEEYQKNKTLPKFVDSEQRATACLLQWDLEEAIKILKEEASYDILKFGLFRRGGIVGFHRSTSERSSLARLAARALLEMCPEAEFTSLYVSSQNERNLHRDSQNQPFTKNYAVVICPPKSGGQLWVELQDGDTVRGHIIAADDGKGTYYGCAHPMREREARMVDPFRRHWVMPWKGSRTVLVGYTVNTLRGLSRQVSEMLRSLGFVPPPVVRTLEDDDPEVVMASIREGVERDHDVEPEDEEVKFALNWEMPKWEWSMDFKGEEDDAHESVEWDVAIPLPTSSSATVSQGRVSSVMMVRLPHQQECIDGPLIRKVEVNYTSGIEEILQNLAKPLAVVHNVSQAEVLPVLERWRKPIQKELDAVSHAIAKLVPGQEEYTRVLSLPGLQILPMKFVFTCKPPSETAETENAPWYRRKARIVVCGNHAQDNENEVYTSGATAEVLRIAIALASKKGWRLGVIDVTAAFLRTPIKNEPGFPVVAGSPPKLLQRLGLTQPGEIWFFTHAFYGMKESPRLWSRFRDGEMTILTFTVNDVIYILKQGKVEDTWWTIVNANQEIEGLVIIYVDDFLICAALEIMKACASAIEDLWQTGGLQVIGRDVPVRFLGVEIEEIEGGFALGQRSYIEELLRLHQISEHALNLIPVPRDMANFDVDEDMTPDPQQIRVAQQCAGELLWVAQRTRPDVSFASSLVASLSTRDPSRVASIMERTLGFLQRTKHWVLSFKADDSELQAFADASFSPSGGKSHQGLAVLLYSCPIMWKSSRQTTVAISTAESELNAELDGALALLSSGAMLEDLGLGMLAKRLWCDSTSAISISKGASSWRTRHLRVKALWLQERLESEEMALGHIRGTHQLADLLTKALTSARISELARLWGLGPREEDDAGDEGAGEDGAKGPRVSRAVVANEQAARVMTVMLWCMMVVRMEARSVEDAEEMGKGKGMELDGDLASMFFILVLIAGVLATWELLKWLGYELVLTWTPGAKERKLRRLKKLKEATSAAIQEEIRTRRARGRREREEEAEVMTTSEIPKPAPTPTASTPMIAPTSFIPEPPVEFAPGNRDVFPPPPPPLPTPSRHERRNYTLYVPVPPTTICFIDDSDCYHSYNNCSGLRRVTKPLMYRQLCTFCKDKAQADRAFPIQG